jgi:hypothetical protein
MGRIEPLAGAEAYKTYGIRMPLTTHWRKATCAEVECPDHTHGWRVRVENLTPDLVHTARTCGRRFRELSVAEGETYLVFEAGQPCFRASDHRVRVERPELYVVRDGDWRGNPRHTTPTVHSGPDSWVDDFATHQQTLADAANEG